MRDLSKPLAPTFGSAKPKKERTVVKYTTKGGTKIKSVERRSGKRVETAKNKAKDFKSRQVTGKGWQHQEDCYTYKWWSRKRKRK